MYIISNKGLEDHLRASSEKHAIKSFQIFLAIMATQSGGASEILWLYTIAKLSHKVKRSDSEKKRHSRDIEIRTSM